MYAYKTAVAVKQMGFRNIKIYNGGLKDWQKSGYAVEARSALPKYEPERWSAADLRDRLQAAERVGCGEGIPALVLLDLRNEPVLQPDGATPRIRTVCPTRFYLFDDLRRPDVRQRIPRDVPVVTITETGNRDDLVARYLHQYGYDNLRSLEFGMRAWIKHGYPVTTGPRP